MQVPALDDMSLLMLHRRPEMLWRKGFLDPPVLFLLPSNASQQYTTDDVLKIIQALNPLVTPLISARSVAEERSVQDFSASELKAIMGKLSPVLDNVCEGATTA